MKLLVLLVAVLAACDKLPSAPDSKAFEAMSPEAKCEATLPRAKRCAKELLVANVASLGDESTREFSEDLGEDMGPVYADEAEAMHENACRGSREDSYQRSVMRCWDVTPCKAFAECVYNVPPAPAPRR